MGTGPSCAGERSGVSLLAREGKVGHHRLERFPSVVSIGYPQYSRGAGVGTSRRPSFHSSTLPAVLTDPQRCAEQCPAGGSPRVTSMLGRSSISASSPGQQARISVAFGF
jgi:hypothetical protein